MQPTIGGRSVGVLHADATSMMTLDSTRQALALLIAAVSLQACALAPASPPPAESETSTQVDALFRDMTGDDQPGIAVAITRGDEVLLSRGYGLANLESRTPMTARTAIRVASLSKQFTAFAILLLEREGQLDLDADIRTYLPWMPDFGHRITTRHLLLHTSGLRSHFALYLAGGRELDDLLRQQPVLNMYVRQRSLNFAPGSQWAYSNGGYVLLAEIVEAITGQSLRQFSEAQLFEPLGMGHSFFDDDYTEIVQGRAESYAAGPTPGHWIRDPISYENVGASSLITTMDDMAKWMINLSRPTVGDSGLIQRMATNGTLDDGTPIAYGLGLQRKQLDGREVIMHTGSSSGFRAVFCYVPAAKLGITIAGNFPYDRIDRLKQVLRIYLGPAANPAPPPAVDTNPARAQTLAGHYFAPQHYALQLEADAGVLYRVHHGGQRSPLTLRQDGSFDADQRASSVYHPVIDANGQVVAIDHHAPEWGRVVRYRRYEPAPTAVAALDELVGQYRSDTLDITYSVERRQDALYLHSIWSHRPWRMTESVPDYFETSAWPMGNIEFERDQGGQVTGLLMHDGYGRERNLQLTRVSATPVPWPKWPATHAAD